MPTTFITTHSPTISLHWLRHRCNLGNPAHYDLLDGFRGFAQWYADDPQAKITSWWFVLPEHGVAIELQDGALISWDGRVVLHCSSVPQATTDLFSVWTSVPAAAERQHDMDASMHNTLRARCIEGGIKHYKYKIGEKVRLLWQTPTGHEKTYLGTVEKLFPNGKILFMETMAKQPHTAIVKKKKKKKKKKGGPDAPEPRKLLTLTVEEVGKFLAPV